MSSSTKVFTSSPAETATKWKEYTKQCTSWLDARGTLAHRYNTHPDTITRAWKRLKAAGCDPFAEAKWAVETDHITTSSSDDTFDVDVESSKAKTVEEVMALCKVDSDVWESRGFNVRRGAKGFAWSARFARKVEAVDPEALLERFIKEAAKHAPRKWAAPAKLPKEADCLYVLNLQDQHLGKLAYNVETGGGDWDIKIAEQTYRDTIKELIDAAPANRIEEVLVIIGSDMLQVDTDKSTTTAGTYVDSDTRLSKAFDTACKMLREVIEELASRFKVRAVVVPGNHDTIMSHVLGRYIEGWFHAHPSVKVDATPRSRKYVSYGKTLLGFDHGDETKMKDLPLIVMRENQTTISQYRFVECMVGHYHHESAEDMKGIIVRVAPALCPPDRWHSRAGWVGSVRRSQGLLYQRDNGLQSIYYSRALD